MPQITPSVGRKVHYFGNPAKFPEPWDATVIKIVRPEADANGCVPPDGPYTPVNLLVIHPDTGATYFEPGVIVGDKTTEGRHYRWMDYQLGQASVPTGQPPIDPVDDKKTLPVGTVTYTDGTTVTGTLPLPDTSPDGAPAG